MKKLTVVTFKWKNPAFRTQYQAWHVNRLAAMFRRHLRIEHDFACVTDDAEGLDPEIRAIPMWYDHADVPSPHAPTEPSCYRRMKLYAGEMADLIGPKLLQCDIDVALTGDVTHLFDRPEPCVLLDGVRTVTPINGSLQLITPGVHEEVWTSFDPKTSPQRAKSAKCYGSDQGWIAYCLKDKVPTWGHGRQGVYFFHKLFNEGRHGTAPVDVRLVSFHGTRGKPWDDFCQRISWIRDAYGTPGEAKAAA